MYFNTITIQEFLETKYNYVHNVEPVVDGWWSLIQIEIPFQEIIERSPLRQCIAHKKLVQFPAGT